MFFFQQLLNQALQGIDSTGMMPAIINVAYGILLVGFLVGLYQSVMRGGDVRSLAVTSIQYLIVAIIVANWSPVFRDVNSSFNSVAQTISQSSGDVYLNWDKQLGQEFSNDSISWWDIISGDIAALISVFLIVIAYVVYVIAIVLFCFFYAMFGSVLYVLGPLVIAFLPMMGAGQIAKSFAINVMIWNGWQIIYAIFGALITAIHISNVTDGLQGFLGFFTGPANSIILGLISIFYAISIAVIPFLAKSLVSGDVGSAAISIVRAAATAAGIVAAGASGFAAGASGAASGTASSGSGGGAAAGSSTTQTASPAATGGAPMSSSSPPPTPGAGSSLHAALAGSASSSTSPSPSSSATGGGSDSSAATKSSGGRSSATRSGVPYRPQGVSQQLAYQAARSLGRGMAGSEAKS